ncbi:MnhB domain-containing protein [Actinacidiphila bryophytorum]|uniref:Multisubunit sodium/proton antiporter, MrpB subunit n=1 Tax=Actinacidiphila bryophytorum TaxID=1436133 RepID=A0A9W4H2T8_9ACTN|nr:MnhB domain-containing protein [Actinacidiphila bryophytorum]MBM9436976.1 sodium:proton antiporter [Actinacidiphila bryophytorum]MBN6542430.1 sodium:proton antiporter [Actinacidiphila bryophytorum]CAG7646058.1 Multisubunit sodium/proton antiporter, MrpB subunit [Actinacidiphila bryophytorum]
MSRRVRGTVFLLAAAVFAVFFALTCTQLPHFGTADHPYGARAVAAAVRQHTANAVSSVNFDQRALDTLGEESILFGAVLGAVVLLRRARDEDRAEPAPRPVLPSTLLLGAGLLPVTVLVGGYVVAHGQLSPGGGFQGGVMLATGLHLAYVAADYRVLRRVRPLAVFAALDAVGAGAFTLLGFAGLIAGGAFLENVLPLGTFNQLASGGLVPLVNAAVGVEVASGVIVLVAQFLDQAVEIDEPAQDAGGRR